MSTPKPLSEIIKEWRKYFHSMSNAHFGGEGERMGNIYRLCADELEQWAKAWGESFKHDISSDIPAEYVAERILGLPEGR